MVDAVILHGIDLDRVQWHQRWAAQVIRPQPPRVDPDAARLLLIDSIITVDVVRARLDARALRGTPFEFSRGVDVFRVAWHEDGELHEHGFTVSHDFWYRTRTPVELFSVDIVTDPQKAERRERWLHDLELLRDLPFRAPPEPEYDDATIVVTLECRANGNWPRPYVYLIRTGKNATPLELRSH